jgi:hypothetical protein
MRFLKNHKALREDRITGELLKNMGNELTEYIYLLVKKIREKGGDFEKLKKSNYLSHLQERG